MRQKLIAQQRRWKKILVQHLREFVSTTDQLQEEPNWNQHAHASVLVVASLLGGWDENNAADRQVIRQLADEDFDSWIRKIQETLQHQPSPVTLSNGLLSVKERAYGKLWVQAFL